MPKKPTSRLGVKKRGERYQARPYIPGVGHKWAGTHDTEDEAIKAAEVKVAEHYTRPPQQETIASFAERWVRDVPRPKESTNDRYDSDAKRFAAAVDPNDKRHLHEYTVPEALRYAKKRPHDYGALRVMFSDARREGLVKENPFSELGISKGPGRKNIVTITEEELDLLIEITYDVHAKEFAPVFAGIIDFAAATTMRPSEIFGLDRTDVDLKREVVHIRRQFYKSRIQLPKNGRKRTLPYLPPRADAAVRRLPRKVPPPICSKTKDEILFYGKEGQRITAGALSGYWEKVRSTFEGTIDRERREEFRSARNPDKPRMDFYELRHFGATQMAELGVEDWVGAEMMGHTDGGKLFRDTYSHPANRVAGQRLKRAFGKNVTPIRAVDHEAEAANG